MIESEYPKVQQAAKDQPVTVIGKFAGVQDAIVVAPILGECRFISLGPDKSIKISAADLAKAHLGNEKAAEKRFDGKPVRISGVIQELRKDDFEVHMKGSNGIAIVFRLGFEGYPQIEADKNVGDTVTIMGICGSLFEKKIEVTQARLSQ